MHVSSTSVARGGVFTALAVICILLTNVFSTSTLFLLIIAACFTAFAYSFSGLKFGIAALAAGAILGLFLSPRKGIIFTYVGIALYLILAQVIERHFYDKGMLKYWGLKCLVFNALFWGLFFIAISVAGVTGIFSAKAIANFKKMDYKWALILLFVVAVEFCFAVIDRVFFMARNRLEPILMKSER